MTCTCGSASASLSAMSPVPSGLLSSTTSKSPAGSAALTRPAMDSRFCRSLYVGMTTITRPADGSSDGFGSVTTLPIVTVGEQAVLIMETYPNGAGHDIRGTGQPRFGQPRSGPSPSGSTRAAPVFRKQRTCAWIGARQIRPASFTLPASPCQLHRGSFTGAAAKEKDPGSAFGPESIPLATGLVSV